MATTSVLPQTDSGVFRIAIREMAPGLVPEPGKVWQRVGSIFSDFCGNGTGNKFTSAQAYWVTNKLAVGSLAPHELIIYLVAGRSASLIKNNYPLTFKQAATTENSFGLTVSGPKGMLSEIYASHVFFSGEPILLANIIIHELMHNKLAEGDGMHDRASGVGRTGGFAQGLHGGMSALDKMTGSTLYATPSDKDAMIPALGRTVNQFQEA